MATGQKCCVSAARLLFAWEVAGLNTAHRSSVMAQRCLPSNACVCVCVCMCLCVYVPAHACMLYLYDLSYTSDLFKNAITS